MSVSGYMGTKGYTLKKNTLAQSELYELRNILNVKPNSQMSGYTTTSTLSVLIDKRPMRKRRRNVKKKKKKKSSER